MARDTIAAGTWRCGGSPEAMGTRSRWSLGIRGVRGQGTHTATRRLKSAKARKKGNGFKIRRFRRWAQIGRIENIQGQVREL